jgi:hypothetical protein
MATRPPFVDQQFRITNADGQLVPAAGYLLHTYDSGTVTPKQTFSNQAGTVANENPIELDADGRCTMWLGTGEYTLALHDPDDAPVDGQQWDDVAGVPEASDDEFVPLEGGVEMTGQFSLSGGATENLHPVPLQQVNALIAASAATVTGLIEDQSSATLSSGTADAFTLTPTVALAALTTGAMRYVIFHTAGGAAPTIAVSGLAATTLKQLENGIKVAAKIASGQCTAIVYDGADWVVSSPQYSLIGTVAANGSFTIPGGLIVKIGAAGPFGLDTAGNTVTFPTAFPNNCFSVFVNPYTDNSVDSGASYSFNAHTFTAASFKINNDSDASSFNWIAFGN